MKDTQARYRVFPSYSHSDATGGRWLRPSTQAHRIPKCPSRDGRHAARRRDDDSHGDVDSASSAWRSTSNENSASYRQSKVIFHGMHSLILFLLPPSAKEFPAREPAVFAELEAKQARFGTKI